MIIEPRERERERVETQAKFEQHTNNSAKMGRKSLAKRILGTLALLSLVSAGIFISQNSLSAQRLTPEEIVAQNAPYPLAPAPQPPVISAPEIVNPLVMSVDNNGYIFIANSTIPAKVTKRLNGDDLSLEEQQSGNLNFYRLSPTSDSLVYEGTVLIPASGPTGWDGTEIIDDLRESDDDTTEIILTDADYYRVDSPTGWKPELQNVVALHNDANGVLYIAEATYTSSFYNPRGISEATVGQSRLIYAMPNGENPTDGYVQFRAILLPAEAQDIITDSRGFVYVATSRGILVYELQTDTLVKIAEYSSERGFITSIDFATSSSSQNLLYATVIFQNVRDGDSTGTVLVLNVDNVRNITENSVLTDNFSLLGNSCHEQEYILTPTARGTLTTRPGDLSLTNLDEIAVDEFGNVFVVDSGGGECTNIVTFTPNQAGDANSGFLPASVLGRRPLFLRDIYPPRDPREDILSTTAIDNDPGLYTLSASVGVKASIYVDSPNNLIYVLNNAGSNKGIKLVPTGVAQLRQGWNLINWGGSDDPDGTGAQRAITTAAELADYISRDDVAAIWSFNSEEQSFEGWPNGNLDNLEDSSFLLISMREGGRYLPYIFQDSDPQNPLIRPAWNLFTYRGLVEPEPTLDCTLPETEEEDDTETDDTEADDTETTETTVAITLPTECSYIDSPSTSASKIQFPYASCLVDQAALSQNGDQISAVYWWNASEQSWSTVYYPTDPDFNPEGFQVLKDARSGDEDQTGISFDDTILVYMNSSSGKTYNGAWRETC